jgi:hypothetical protein
LDTIFKTIWGRSDGSGKRMIEDGTFAGEGLTILQTLTYFVIAPTILFVVISFFAYITAKETRSKKKSKPVSLTSIE